MLRATDLRRQKCAFLTSSMDLFFLGWLSKECSWPQGAVVYHDSLMYHKRDISRQPPICLMFQLGPQEGPTMSIKSVSTAAWRRDRKHKHPRIPCDRVRQHQPDEPCTSDSARQWKTQKTIWKSFGSRGCDTHNSNRFSSYSSLASSSPSQPSSSVSSTVSKGYSGK